MGKPEGHLEFSERQYDEALAAVWSAATRVAILKEQLAQAQQSVEKRTALALTAKAMLEKAQRVPFGDA